MSPAYSPLGSFQAACGHGAAVRQRIARFTRPWQCIRGHRAATSVPAMTQPWDCRSDEIEAHPFSNTSQARSNFSAYENAALLTFSLVKKNIHVSSIPIESTRAAIAFPGKALSAR